MFRPRVGCWVTNVCRSGGVEGREIGSVVRCMRSRAVLCRKSRDCEVVAPWQTRLFGPFPSLLSLSSPLSFSHSYLTVSTNTHRQKISRYHNNPNFMAQPIFDEHPLQDYLRRSFQSHQRKASHTHSLSLFSQNQAISSNPYLAQSPVYRVLSPTGVMMNRIMTSSCVRG